MNLISSFQQNCKEKKLIQKNDRILVAFSGGKDSLCLLSLLHRLKNEFGIEVAACHVHHKIRSFEADRDADFCAEYCKKMEIPFLLEIADVPSFCKKEKFGLEEGARLLRYALLEQAAKKIACNKIATAHTLSDQAETVLFRLVRGSGTLGASGIPERRGAIIRPLLPFSSEEILDYLEKEGLLFIEDSSNSDILFTRNRIRNQILPELKKINPKAEKALDRFAAMARWSQKMAESAADQWQKEHSADSLSNALPLMPLKKLAQNEADFPLLYELLSRMAKKEKIVIDFERFLALTSLLFEPIEGKIIEIQNGFCFRVSSNFLHFEKNDCEYKSILYQVKIQPGNNPIPACGANFFLSDKRRGKVENVNKKLLKILAASDRIEGDLFVRNWKSGDTIRLNQMTKSVKKLFQEAGIPKEYRHRIPLCCDEKGILWIPFIGLCDRARDPEALEVVTFSLSGDCLFEVEKIIERKAEYV
jgi:tRNA(Ile)-lysidine synthase